MDQQTLTTVLMFGALIIGGYFLMIRPQQKKAKEQQELIAKLGDGDRVMLTSGIFATIRHMGTKQAIVEVSPGVELTLLRQAIVRAVPADEEEFEYSDDDAVPDDLAGLEPEPEPESDRAPQTDSDPTTVNPDEPPAPAQGTDKR